MKDILLVIPSYNEEKNIETVVGELVEKFPQLDYIVVNDGSTDNTAKICQEKGYHLLNLPVNLGLAGCFQAGMKYACEKGYSCAIQFDGDGQHRPEYIGKMREKMDEGYDIVSAAGVVQWVAMKDFLRNLREIMRKNGYVLIYDFGISDRMKGNAAYTRWWRDAYLKEFPRPFRNEYVWTAEDVRQYGFSMLGQEQYEMEYEFDSSSFVRFMMLQSNVNAKIEGGGRA